MWGKKLLKAKIPIQISCPVMKQNKDTFVDVIKWGYNNNIAVAVEPVILHHMIIQRIICLIG